MKNLLHRAALEHKILLAVLEPKMKPPASVIGQH